MVVGTSYDDDDDGGDIYISDTTTPRRGRGHYHPSSSSKYQLVNRNRLCTVLTIVENMEISGGNLLILENPDNLRYTE